MNTNVDRLPWANVIFDCAIRKGEQDRKNKNDRQRENEEEVQEIHVIFLIMAILLYFFCRFLFTLYML